MKRFTSLMLLLLCAVTTWAQTSYETSTAESPKWYTIGSYNRGGYLTNVGTGSSVEHVAMANGSLWYFEAVENNENNGVYLVNAVKDGENTVYLGSDKTASTTPAVWYLLPNGINENGLAISSTNPISESSCVDANNYNTGVGAWNPRAGDWEGTTWCFLELGTDIQNALDAFKAREGKEEFLGEYIYSADTYNELYAAYETFKANATLDNYNTCKALADALPMALPTVGKFYLIEAPLFYNTQGVHKALYSDGTNAGWKTLDKADKSFYWTPAETENGLAWKNVNDNKFMLGKSANNTTWTMEDASTGAEFSIVILASGEAQSDYQYAISVSGRHMHAGSHDSGNGNNGNIISWETNSANSASAWTITETVDPDLGAAIGALENKIAELQDYIANTGVNPGEYAKDATDLLAEPVAAAQAVIDGGSESSADYTAALETLNTAVADVDLTPNPVVAGTYRIVSAYFNDTKAISVYGYDTTYGQHRTPAWAPENTNDPLQYWVLEENGEGFNIKAAYEGNYITTATSMSATAKVATFTNLGKAQFNITLSGDAYPIHANGWNWGTAAAPLTIWDGGKDSPSAWKLVAINNAPEFTYTLNVGVAGWATLMLGFDATIPANVKAYTVSAVENGWATLETVESVLPAKIPVIIEASEGEYTFTATAEAAVAVTENALAGTLYPKNIVPEGTAYVLANGANGVGLYKAELNQASNTAFLNNANKAYLVIPETAAASNVACYSFRFGGDTTGISEVKGENGNVKAIFDLTGRKVNSISAPGIYIVNGKKVLVK